MKIWACTSPVTGGRGTGTRQHQAVRRRKARAPPGWSAWVPLEVAQAMNSPRVACSVLAGGTARGAVVVRLHAVHLQR